MKKSFTTFIFLSLLTLGFAQVDTISENLYQLDGRIGIGKVNYGSYFNPSLMLYNGWLQVSDETDHDAGLVIAHLHKYGYGFARTLHMVYEGVNGDPYTEFRTRHTSDEYTITSWSIGAINSADDKLIISNAVNTLTGASPSKGDKVVTIRTTGEFGIGTSEPNAKLEIADGDVFISDIERGIIMRSPDGQCWRGTMDNSGALRFVAIDCPQFIITAVQPLKSNNEIMIYPNPTDGSISVGINNKDLKDLSFNIYDLNGKLLDQGIFKSSFENIDISGLNSGTYILTINNRIGQVIYSGKMIKQ